MEIKIPKEVRLHKETVLFGLTLRQLLCSALAVGAAVAVYLALGPVLGKETASWVCILSAAPFAVAGFFQYNGLTLGRFLWALLKSCAPPPGYSGRKTSTARLSLRRGRPITLKTFDAARCGGHRPKPASI